MQVKIRRFRFPSHTQIPNEVFDELMAELSGAEFKVLCYIARRTFGFGKMEDAISQAQLAGGIVRRSGERVDAGTGLSRSTVQIAVRGLLAKGLIAIDQRSFAKIAKGEDGKFETARYRILVEGEDADPLEEVADQGGSPKIGIGVDRKSGPGSPIFGHTKERITKESISSLPAAADAEAAGERSEQTAEQDSEELAALAEAVLSWARERRIARMRDDRTSGPPSDRADVWARIMSGQGIALAGVADVLDVACSAADRASRNSWAHWRYLDIQVQAAAERFRPEPQPAPPRHYSAPQSEDPDSEWAVVKQRLRGQLPPIAFANWVEDTRQIAKTPNGLIVSAPDEATRAWLSAEWSSAVASVARECGLGDIEFRVAHEPE